MEHVCEVWSASTGLWRPALEGLTTDQERARADRLSVPADRARTLLAAALVRLIAARVAGVDPADADAVRRIGVDRSCPTCVEAHGKPSIGGGVHLSVSHAGELVLVAMTRVAPVGVDVEPLRRGADAEVAARWALTPQERARIDGAGDALRYWIRKESIVKATGEGLAAPLADVCVSAPREPARLLGWVGRPDQPCTLIDLNPPDGYVASLAVLSSAPFSLVERTADDLLAA